MTKEKQLTEQEIKDVFICKLYEACEYLGIDTEKIEKITFDITIHNISGTTFNVKKNE